MGELLLCNYSIAAMPYYVESLSSNIYSLEELCYLMEHHVFLLDEALFSEELFEWIEQEAGAKNLAEELRVAEQKKSGLPQLLELLYKETAYWTEDTFQQLVQQTCDLQHKSVWERRKIRADYYAESKKYTQAIAEYRKILQMEEECRNNPVLCGNIWHNQGIAFAGMFLFEEAKACFLEAYKYHRNIASIYAAITTCWYMGDIEEAKCFAERYDISEGDYQKKVDELAAASERDEVKDLEQQIELILTKEDVPLSQNKELLAILTDWKEEYRISSR